MVVDEQKYLAVASFYDNTAYMGTKVSRPFYDNFEIGSVNSELGKSTQGILTQML